MPRPFPRVSAEQCGVFSAKQSTRDGWTSHALRYAVARGRVIRLRVGAYQVVDLEAAWPGLSSFEQTRWRHAAPAIAVALTSPGAAASHSTAVVLHGIPLIFLPQRSCVSVVPWHTGEAAGVHLHRCVTEPWTVPLRALLRTGVERTVIDLGREHGLAAGVVAVDYVLHIGLTTYPRLHAALDHCARWPGVRTAREAVAFADPRSESVLESRSRLALHDWGLPAPELQVRIGDADGRFLGRVDFYWDEFGVVGEADGALKYDGRDPDALLKEKRRQGRMERVDLPVVRWGNADLRDFGAFVAQLRRQFARSLGRRRHWTVLPPL